MENNKPEVVKLEDRFGYDLLVKDYLLTDIPRKIDYGIYYKHSFLSDNLEQTELYTLLPFINEDNWNGDKLCFNNFNQITNFCETLNIPFRKG